MGGRQLTYSCQFRGWQKGGSRLLLHATSFACLPSISNLPNPQSAYYPPDAWKTAVAFTYFFRDLQTLELLVDESLPTLCSQAFIRIWDAGCAHGPEPYSLAMLLRERMSDFVFRNVRIYATDVEAQFGPQVAAGVYTDQETKRIPAPFLQRYFRPAGEPNHVQVIEEIRAKVVFARHDLLSLTPPRDDFSLIVCKNVLLHFDDAQRQDVYRMFHRALRPDGLLATEHTQKLPEALQRYFRCIAPYAQVAQRLNLSEDRYSYVDRPHDRTATTGLDRRGAKPTSVGTMTARGAE